jgi:hypothetical protein
MVAFVYVLSHSSVVALSVASSQGVLLLAGTLQGLPPRHVREYSLPSQPDVLATVHTVKEGPRGMQCPHCHSEIDVKPHTFALGEDQDGPWHVSTTRCKVCERLIVELCGKDSCTYPIRPLSSGRPRLTSDVPAEFESEYQTACELLTLSPESSAAIARRLLRRFLAAQSGAEDAELSALIEATTESPELQPYLREALRTLVAAARLEPQSEKSLRPHTLMPVEPGEAEWTLDVLQTLFEAYYVQPARLQRLQSALEEKVGRLAPPATSETTAEEVGPAEDADGADAPIEPADEAEPVVAAPLVAPPLP